MYLSFFLDSRNNRNENEKLQKKVKKEQIWTAFALQNLENEKQIFLEKNTQELQIGCESDAEIEFKKSRRVREE